MSVTNSMSVTISLSTARSAPQEVLGRRWRQQGAYGEVFLAPIAVRSPSAQSSQGCDFRLDSSKIVIPSLQDSQMSSSPATYHRDVKREWYHQKDFDQVGIEEDEPKCSSTHLHHGTNGSKTILGGALTTLEQCASSLAFSVHRIIGYGCMINASGQLTVDREHPILRGGWRVVPNAYKWSDCSWTLEESNWYDPSKNHPRSPRS